MCVFVRTRLSMSIHFSNIVLSLSLTHLSSIYKLITLPSKTIEQFEKDYETILGVHNDIRHVDSPSSHPHTPEVVNGILNSPDDISVFKGPQSPQTPHTGSPMTSSPTHKKGMTPQLHP